MHFLQDERSHCPSEYNASLHRGKPEDSKIVNLTLGKELRQLQRLPAFYLYGTKDRYVNKTSGAYTG